ncbi:MAG: DUF11 domain-containing protein, partial [Actinomycetota bacterium]|nr:DUF11 domain-containing protein [Actinomycetota bacterium]
MRRTHLPRAAAFLGTTALVASTCAAFVVTAPVASAATGAYSGSAASDLVHITAAQAAGVGTLADATVAPVTSNANTASTPRVRSFATNANAQLFDAAINQNLVVEAEQTALPDHATGVHDELLSVPAAPALTATVTSADAHSRWNADESCVLGGPISNSLSKVADAVVLPASPLTVALTNDADPTGAVVSNTIVGLVKQPASAANYAVRSISSTQITSLSLLAGAIQVEVVTAPRVVATATGVPGTSTVALTQPVLVINGQTLVSGDQLSPINIPGAPVVTLTVGTLTKNIAADGTSATGSGNLLHLTVLGVAGVGTLLDLTIGDVTATAKAPAGGVNCSTGPTDDPLREARKDTSATTVNAGKSFDYTITVPNRGTSPLTNVTVKDTVSGSPSLILVKAVPSPTSQSGNVYNFSLGTIAPNEVKTIVMTFKVPSGAPNGTDYSNKAVITAVYAGKTITKTVTTPYPSVDGPGSGPCDLSQSTKFASHIKVKTGENFTYYVNVFNQGGQACTNIVVKDVLISGVKFVACTANCTHSGQLVTWKIASLSAGASKMLAVTVKTTATSGKLPNTADITPASGTGGTPKTPGPTVTNVSVLSPSHPAKRGDQALPRTGGSPVVPLAGFM